MSARFRRTTPIARTVSILSRHFVFLRRLGAALVIGVLLPCVAAGQAPAAQGVQLALPAMSEAQFEEFVGDLASYMEATTDFNRVSAAQISAALPAPASGVSIVCTLASASGIARIGVLRLPRRRAELRIQTFSDQHGKFEPTTTDANWAIAVGSVLAERSRANARVRVSALEPRTLVLSYVDADAAIFALRAMGYSAITDSDGAQPAESADTTENMRAAPAPAMPPSATSPWNAGPADSVRPSMRFPSVKNIPAAVSLDQLPLIIKMPSTEVRSVALAGNESNASIAAQSSQFGTSMIPNSAAPLPETAAGGTAELLILVHPDYPAQFSRIKRIVQEIVDRPARQVVIEGLVLEVSSEGMKELGVQWDRKSGRDAISLGSFGAVADGGSAMSIIHDTAAALTPAVIAARINALLSTNRAEVLSRPSVITLDNRQATIRVGTDVPVARSKNSGGNGNQVSFDFSYLPTGILLNVRPRISEDAQEVSMQVDATVSAIVPNQDLRVIDPVSKIILTSAPTVATRRVQTQARIRDNTPLIIGGLVSKNTAGATARVPLLGELPVLGALFGHTTKSEDAREVIIVLTPTVVTENIRETKGQYPKDDPRFDSLDTTLFKEHYRIRAEDLVDSAHFRFNQRFLAFRVAANRIIERRPELETKWPFSLVAGNRIPAESIFVSGMLYHMLQRLDASAGIPLENLRYFESDGNALPQPVSVADALARYAGGQAAGDFFSRRPGKALALVFRPTRSSLAAEDMFAEPVPEVSVVDCPDRAAWRKALWLMNQPDERGARYTVLLQDPSDLKRLQLAVATQNTVLNNGGVPGMVFDRWLPGRMLHLQEVSPNWQRLLNAQIAQYFFIGEYYYPHFVQQHSAQLEAVEKAILDLPPNLREGINLPPKRETPG